MLQKAKVELPMNWHEIAAETQWNIQPFVNGGYKPSRSSEYIDTVNPASETILCRYSAGHSADVDEAVRVARQRFEDGCWSGLQPVKRAEILFRLADLIVKHKETLALLDTLEMGKPIRFALSDAANYAPDLLRSYARVADKLAGVVSPPNGRSLSFNTYEPRGVVGAIAPWNFPSVCAVLKFAPALAAGNTVVLKPSELSPSSALKLAELALEAGVPEGVLNVVPGLGSTVGAALALHPDVDMLSFTGSTVTGRKIMEACGKSNGKPVLLECGGKSPEIVFDDVENLDMVADAVVQSVTWNQGQVCGAQTRLLVQESIAEPLLEKVVHRMRKCQPGDPLDEANAFGPLASAAQRDRVKRYIEQGIRSGANPLLLGEIQERGGCYISPTIFDRVDPKMSIAREEIFGPVLCVMRFSSESDAISIANGTDYGLTATVWTRNLGRAKRMAHSIRVGAIAVRTSGEEGEDTSGNLSFEPRKASGFGSEVGIRGLEAYSTLKLVIINGD